MSHFKCDCCHITYADRQLTLRETDRGQYCKECGKMEKCNDCGELENRETMIWDKEKKKFICSECNDVREGMIDEMKAA